MSTNAQKTPLNRSLNRIAVSRALDQINKLGSALPCTVTAVSGSIVAVKFEVRGPYTLPSVTVPKAESQYIRSPTQVGDHGVVVPSDASLGGISGLGGGVASLTLQANLSALVWVPVASSSFSAPDDPNAALIYGPDGAVIRTTDKSCSIKVTATGVTIKVPATKTLTISSLPLAATGLASGALWNSGGQVMVVP